MTTTEFKSGVFPESILEVWAWTCAVNAAKIVLLRYLQEFVFFNQKLVKTPKSMF